MGKRVADLDNSSYVNGSASTLNGASFHTLWVTNDNDFVSAVAGGDEFFVYAVSDAHLGTTFQAQAIAAVPEAGSYAPMGAGLAPLGSIAHRRRH